MPKNLDAEKNNPCKKEQDFSYKCLNDNNYDREKCEIYFANYNNCKRFWNNVQSDRRRRGIFPILPEIQDREEVKSKYLSSSS